jgi:hypothetical protein
MPKNLVDKGKGILAKRARIMRLANIQFGSDYAATSIQKEPNLHRWLKDLFRSPWDVENWAHFHRARCLRCEARDLEELDPTYLRRQALGL